MIFTQHATLENCHLADGLVVIIDVIRAFTTACYAFHSGVEEMILMKDVDEAFQLHHKLPHTLLMGERDGIPIPGFHFDNSPVDIAKADVKGRTLIFRTSSGTQGVVRAVCAKQILAASFANAEATVQRIRVLNPSKITFVITGHKNGGAEDLALAEYLQCKLTQEFVDPFPYLERVRNSPLGKLFSSGMYSYRRKEDLDLVCLIDSFPFSLEVFNEDNRLILRPV